MSSNNFLNKIGIAKDSPNLTHHIDDSQKAKVIIDSIEDGVILIDEKFTIQLMNPGASAISGWPINDAIGIHADLVIQLINDKSEPVDKANNPLHQIFTSNKSITRKDLNLVSRDKKTIPVSLHVSPLTDSSGKVYQAVAVINDIAEERSNERERADFISTASHEMRTPVAAIEGYLALALNEKVSKIDDRARDYLEKAHSAAEHLGMLFQDLLTSAKADDGRLTNHPQVTDIGELVKQLVGDFNLVAKHKGIDIELSAGDNQSTKVGHEQGEKVLVPIFYAYVDADRIREVITNLFDNALKYTAAGKITIGITGNDQIVQFFVRDTGSGIPADDIPHLFQKFYRVDNTSTRTIGGTGLGLYICRKIVELYNGTIWAESELNRGSVFYVNLPRLSSASADAMKSSSVSN